MLCSSSILILLMGLDYLSIRTNLVTQKSNQLMGDAKLRNWRKGKLFYNSVHSLQVLMIRNFFYQLSIGTRRLIYITKVQLILIQTFVIKLINYNRSRACHKTTRTYFSNFLYFSSRKSKARNF